MLVPEIPRTFLWGLAIGTSPLSRATLHFSPRWTAARKEQMMTQLTMAQFSFPAGTLSQAKAIFLSADTSTNTIRKVTPVGEDLGCSQNLAGTTGPVGSTIQMTASMATRGFGFFTGRRVRGYKNGSLFVVDHDNNTIANSHERRSADWNVTTIAGWGGQRGAVDGTQQLMPVSGVQGESRWMWQGLLHHRCLT